MDPRTYHRHGHRSTRPSIAHRCPTSIGRRLSLQAKASTLVTTGLYARIRNPIYVFGALFLAGIIIWTSRPWLLLIFVILIPMQILRSRKESKVLEEKFGPAYVAYKQKTWF